jgi:catechol 2,3-dioxygenase-like lactoylglutathione lyase family enzyme
MGVGLTKILQVKIPVTNLQRSVSWYVSLLDLELAAEFVEHGVLRGVALVDRDGEYTIALRDREVCASQPNLAGYDLIGLGLASAHGLQRLIERCDRFGVAHGEIEDRGLNRLAVDVPDPDGTVLRFIYAGDNVPDHFVGVESGDDGQVSLYHTPTMAVKKLA